MLKKLWGRNEVGILIPTVILVIIIQIINPAFLSGGNISNVLRATGFTLITALGMTFILIAGGLDLSVGSILALGGVVAGLLMVGGTPLWLAILLAIVSGAIIGLINGVIIVKFKIPPLIMTLGMYYMARGAVYILTQGVPVYPLPDSFQAIEQGKILGIPSIVIIAGVLAIVAHFVLSRTTFGRKVYAVGGNTEAAHLSGIRIGKTNIAVYVLTGGLAALTGILMASRLASAQAGAGMGYELTVIAAVIIGGTSTFGGAGTILGTVIGALFMNILSNGMTLMKVSVYWQNLVVGAVLVLAVIVDQYRRNKKKA